MEPTGPPCTPQMGSGLGTLCQNPLPSTGKDPNPLLVEPTPLPCPHTARGPAPHSDPGSLLLASRAPNTTKGWEWGPCSHPSWALHRALLWSPSSWKHRGVPGGDTCATAAPSPLWGSPTARPPGTAAGQGGVRAPPATGSGDLHVSALTPGRRGWDFSSFAPFNGHPGLR